MEVAILAIAAHGWNWTAIGAVLVGVGSLATGSMAVFTRSLASKTKDMADAALREAQAVEAQGKSLQEQAKAMAAQATATKELAEEARTDRELAWQPYLTMTVIGGSTTGDDWIDRVQIENVGAGAALECGYFVYRNNRWGFRFEFSFRGGAGFDSGNVPGQQISSTHPFPVGMFDAPGGTPDLSPSDTVRVVVCKDVLGKRWRFFENHVPEWVGRDDPNPPAWVVSAPWSP